VYHLARICISNFWKPWLSVTLCTLTDMDKRVEFRVDAAEFDAWKAAAGEVPLSAWIRGACKARLGGGEREAFERHGLMGSGAAVERGFSPDFKGKK
jgi:hypothetical protein